MSGNEVAINIMKRVIEYLSAERGMSESDQQDALNLANVAIETLFAA